jgi:hypothetical protein
VYTVRAYKLKLKIKKKKKRDSIYSFIFKSFFFVLVGMCTRDCMYMGFGFACTQYTHTS